MFEVQSQQPGYFSLYVQDRVRGVQLVLQASHFRLERAHLRIQRVAFARLCAALLRGQLPKRTLAPRLAPSRQMGAVQPLAAKQSTHLTGLRTALRLLNPSRRSSRPTSPGCVQRSASSRIRSRYCAVNWRRVGLATPGSVLRARPWGPRRYLRVRGRSCAPGPGGLVATLLDPQGRNGTLVQCHRLSLCDHRFSSPPPYSNSKGCWCLSHVGREGSARGRMAASGAVTARTPPGERVPAGAPASPYRRSTTRCPLGHMQGSDRDGAGCVRRLIGDSHVAVCGVESRTTDCEPSRHHTDATARGRLDAPDPEPKRFRFACWRVLTTCGRRTRVPMPNSVRLTDWNSLQQTITSLVTHRGTPARDTLEGRAWRDARLERCPNHPHGGCSLARHGTWVTARGHPAVLVHHKAEFVQFSALAIPYRDPGGCASA